MGRRYDTVSLPLRLRPDDEFVGVVKSVIRVDRPARRHRSTSRTTSRPYDVRAGGLALARGASRTSRRGIVLAVVDPGVGTDRRRRRDRGGDGRGVLVGPDNGLLAAAVAMVGGADRAVELTNPEYHLPAPGPTFAGRDVFAPGRRAPLQRRRPRRSSATLVDLDLAHARARAAHPCRGATASSARCSGSTASATRSSTSTPTRSQRSATGSRCGSASTRRTARRVEALRRARPRRARPRRRLVRAAGAVSSTSARPPTSCGRGEQRGAPRASRRSGDEPAGHTGSVHPMSTCTR